MNFYKRFIGDITAKTGGLSLARMGAYDRLLDHYFSTEKPIVPEEVYSICRAMSKQDRSDVDHVLERFWDKTAEGYVQAKADEVIAKARPLIEAARANGKKGGRPKKTENPDKTQRVPKNNPEETQQKPSAKAIQSQISSSGEEDEFDRPADAGQSADGKPPSKTGLVWEAYRTAYHDRYGAEPIRNRTVNGQLANFVDRLGIDAPRVAAFYLSHEGAFYVGAGHSVALLLRDAEKLHTEWTTGRTMAPAKVTRLPLNGGGKHAAASRTIFSESHDMGVIDAETH